MGHTLCNGEMPWNKPLHFHSYSSFSFTFILPRAAPLNASPNLHSGQVFVDNKHEGVAYKQEGALLHRSNSAPAQQGCRRNSEDLNQRCAPAELGLGAGAGAREEQSFWLSLWLSSVLSQRSSGISGCSAPQTAPPICSSTNQTGLGGWEGQGLGVGSRQGCPSGNDSRSSCSGLRG